MVYELYELNQLVLAPWRAASAMNLNFWRSPNNPWKNSVLARMTSASLELFERATRRFDRPRFGIEETIVAEKPTAVRERIVFQKPFMNLRHFEKAPAGASGPQPKLLLVAPMSGHYATLLRGTVEAMLPYYDIYITDWADAREVPVSEGRFDLEDYTDYIIDTLRYLGPGVVVMAVCQPSVPVLAAVALMNETHDKDVPSAMILIGGPIDTRRNPTAVNKVAEERGLDWFKRNVIMQVPAANPGVGRLVYPGFLQLTGFIAMNFDRHMQAHRDMFWHLVKGEDEQAERGKEFYDEYMSVMDLTAEFYLQTVERVFIAHDLPNGSYMHKGHLVDPAKITETALLTIEGEKDDISGVGQTEAAQDLCAGLNPDKKRHHLQMGVGHYGVFSGSRFRNDVLPVIREFTDAQVK